MTKIYVPMGNKYICYENCHEVEFNDPAIHNRWNLRFQINNKTVVVNGPYVLEEIKDAKA